MKKQKKEIVKCLKIIQEYVMCDDCKHIVSVSTKTQKLKNGEKCLNLKIIYREYS